jgi:hypothetical protein
MRAGWYRPLSQCSRCEGVGTQPNETRGHLTLAPAPKILTLLLVLTSRAIIVIGIGKATPLHEFPCVQPVKKLIDLEHGYIFVVQTCLRVGIDHI